MSEHLLQLTESERLQEVIQSFHMPYILTCMIGQQKRVPRRSSEFIVPNLKESMVKVGCSLCGTLAVIAP